MTPFETLIRAAATWRLTRLVVDDEITRDLREAVSRRWPDSKVEYLVNCSACASVWAGALASVLPLRVCGVIALSAGTLGAKWVAEVIEAGVGAAARRG